MRDLMLSRAMPPEVTDGRAPLPEGLAGAVMLLGSFDGMHLGHAALALRARAEARRRGVPLAVLQCDPHPRAFFGAPGRFRIATGSVQRQLLAAGGIDLIYAPRFDAAFAATPPEVFLRRILAGRLRLGAVVTGADFRFGRARTGTVALLQDLAPALGIGVVTVAEQRQGGVRISSSAVRAALRAGDIALAERLLGHPFRTAVFPEGAGGWVTCPDQLLPPPGLWDVTARDAAGQCLATLQIRLTTGSGIRGALPRQSAVLDWRAGR